MKHFSVFLLFVFVLSITSCDLFNSDSDSDGDGDCKLVKSSFDIPNDPARGETVYTYNSNDQLVSIESADWDLDPVPYRTRVQIVYSGDLVSEINSFTTFMNNPEEKEFEYEFYYENGELDSVYYEGYNAFENSDGYFLVETGSAKVNEIKGYTYNNLQNSFNHFATNVFNWSGNNLSSIESTIIATGEQTRSVYEYDSMKSPSAPLAYSFFSKAYYALSENNIIKHEYYQGNNLLNTQNFDYTYTSEDYPLTSQQMGGYPLYTHEYDCN